jgi:beta-lactamase superfamily II metal-dependent hydrolase
MLHSVKDTINTAFVIQNEGYTIVVDGGFPHEDEHLYEYIRDLGGVVDAWFLTHIHDDHVCALINILKKYEDITVKKAYYNFPSDEFLGKCDSNRTVIPSVELSALVRNTLEERKIPIVTVNEGDVYEFGAVEVKILQTPDESITANPINNSSCVFTVTVNGQKILFLGDLGVEGGQRLLSRYSAEELRSDYVQMAHHGQSGVGREVYEAIRPRFCLWCTPSWLWDNVDRKIGRYDTGRFKTLIVRGWMSEMGCVERHYRMIDGTNIIEI